MCTKSCQCKLSDFCQKWKKNSKVLIVWSGSDAVHIYTANSSTASELNTKNTEPNDRWSLSSTCFMVYMWIILIVFYHFNILLNTLHNTGHLWYVHPAILRQTWKEQILPNMWYWDQPLSLGAFYSLYQVRMWHMLQPFIYYIILGYIQVMAFNTQCTKCKWI